jgi:putative ABC transport system permease protein
MIKHYIKIAARSLARQKVLAGINIFGLSVGIACFSLILLYAVHEFSYDRFHKNKDRIFRVIEWNQGGDRDPGGTASMYTPVGPALKRDFADVEYAVRIKSHGQLVKVNNEVFKIGVKLADPDFFNMFTFPLLYGNAVTALDDPHNVVITKERALQLFGTTQAVGKQLSIKMDSAFVPFTVSAVADNVPENSSVQFDIIGSFEFIANHPMVVSSMNNWHMTIGMNTYVQLKAGSRLNMEANRLALFREKYYSEENAPKKTKGKKKKIENRPPVETSFRLQPIRDVHTNAAIEDNPVDPKNIWILLSIAAGVLLIACINFTTLAIGRSAGRAKEVGVRKVIGGQRKQLIYQFLSESLLLSILSTIIGLLLAYLLLPMLNQLADRQLTFSLKKLPELGWLLAGLTILVGILAGSYPALILSGFKPIEVLKSKIRVGGSNLFTRSLVTLQFVLSTGLIIATIIILQQVSFMRNKNIGFNKENVVALSVSDVDAKKIYPLFKQAMQTQRGILGVTASEIGLGANEGQMGGRVNIEGKKVFALWFPVDNDYLTIMGLQLAAGRYLNDAMASGSGDAVIINEAFLQENLGIPAEQAIGKQITGFYNDSTVKTIIGVAKNMNVEDLTRKVRPQLFYLSDNMDPARIFVRLSSGDPGPQLAAMQRTWKKLAPDHPFQYNFLDEKFDNFYKAEQRWSAMVGWAGGISIFLACLGLFGLASLAAVNRTKEIGIRKVLGASVTHLVGLLSKDFIRLIIIALVIAAPLAWYFMNNWLQSYAYRIDLHWLVFAVTGAFAIVIAIATVSIQAVKAAMANPVESLRTE